MIVLLTRGRAFGMQKLAHEIYSFDEFKLDLTRGALFRGVDELKLRPKSFDVLKYFAENSGRLISKDELIEAVWHETAVTDDSLVQCLKDIRRALKDNGQRIIKTVPRRGYIFEKEVNENGSATIYTEETTGVHLVIEETEEKDVEDVIESRLTRGSFAAFGLTGMGERVIDNMLAETAQTKTESTFLNLSISIKHHRRAVIPLMVVLTIAVIAVAAWRFNSNKNIAENSPPLSALLFQNAEVKSITHVGNIVNNAISPDGKYVVYTTADSGRESLWLRQIATDSTQQTIPPTHLRYFGVTFSRDGEYIYYVRSDRPDPFPRTLYRIPKLGGVSEKVLANMDWCPTFSPDGSQMAFVRNSLGNNDSVMMIANADGSNERKLATRRYGEPYTYPAWSPDGQTIAASAGSVELGDSFRDVVTVNVADGAETTLTTRKWYWIGSLAWLADGSGLIMSGNPEKSHIYNQLWLLSYPSGEAHQIKSDSNNYALISLTADSRMLLAGHTELLTHLWIAPEGNAVRARRVTSGLGGYREIGWTRDGKLAFTAFSNNSIDIYTREPDGAENKQLTVNAGTNWGAEVSIDNRYIVFGSDRTGDFHVWRMDIDGGNPLQLTDGSGEKFAEISPDGKWVVYTAFQDWTLWKVSIEGGEPVQIAKSYARQSAISPDGKWIVYMASENNRHIVMPFEGGSPAKIFDLPPDAPQLQTVRWSPDSQFLQFIVRRDGVENIWQQPLNGGAPNQVTNFPSDRIFSYDWSYDGKTLAVIRGAWTSDMVLLSQKK